MRLLAERLSVPILEHSVDGLLGSAMRSVRAIMLSPSGYEPRDEFTLAHELAELHIPAAWHATLPERVKERMCDRVAAALLLPPPQFLYALFETNWSLPLLRRRFPIASYEAIARRIVDLKPSTSAAMWTAGKRSWWRGPAAGEDVRLLVRAERQALRIANRTGFASVADGDVIARAWHLTAKDKRVALTVCSPAA